MEPIFEKSFIFDSYACRKEKGAQKAIVRCQKFIRTSGGGGNLKEKRIYCFKGDIQKYFDSIDRKILKEIIQKKIKVQDCYDWLI